MHLRAVSDCLPLFAAAEHFTYLKYANFYVHEMCQIEVKHPNVFRMSSQNYHVICCSDHFWSGLSSNVVIEQSLKSRGGLIHGSRITSIVDDVSFNSLTI